MGMVDTQPPPITGLEFYIEAFRELSTCRINAMSLGPIPFTAIIQYCNLYHIEDVEEFRYLIRRMDDKVIEIESKKDSKNGSKN